MPPGTDLPGLIGRLPPSPLRDEREVAVRAYDEGESIAPVDLHRTLYPETKTIDDPRLQLLERFREDFEVVRVVRFAYRGE
jgi:hypothetical protein